MPGPGVSSCAFSWSPFAAELALKVDCSKLQHFHFRAVTQNTVPDTENAVRGGGEVFLVGGTLAVA